MRRILKLPNERDQALRGGRAQSFNTAHEAMSTMPSQTSERSGFNMKGILTVVLGCAALCYILSTKWNEIVVVGAVRDARALLDPNAREGSLPAEVTLTLDGATATFHRGSADYATLLSALRTVDSPQAREAAGAMSPQSGRMRSGELAIRSFGVPFHFPLDRLVASPHYLRLRLPHLDRAGFGYHTIIDDGRLGPLLHGDVITKP